MTFGISFVGSKLDAIPGMKISLKRNILFCLFITTVVVLAVYQYCDGNRNRCYPYPVDGPGQYYRITNESFATIKDMYTSGHVKWIPKEVDKGRKAESAKEVSDFIRFTNDLTYPKETPRRNESIVDRKPSEKSLEVNEPEVSRYKKETLKMEDSLKDGTTVLNKQEKALRRFERVDRLIDDHDDEDDETIERRRAMPSNEKPFSHKKEEIHENKASSGTIDLINVRFRPLDSTDTRAHASTGNDIKTTSNTSLGKRTLPASEQISVSDVNDHLHRFKSYTTKSSSLVSNEKTNSRWTKRSVTKPSRFVTKVDDDDVESDDDYRSTVIRVVDLTNGSNKKHNTVMRDVIQGNVKDIMTGLREKEKNQRALNHSVGMKNDKRTELDLPNQRDNRKTDIKNLHVTKSTSNVDVYANEYREANKTLNKLPNDTTQTPNGHGELVRDKTETQLSFKSLISQGLSSKNSSHDYKPVTMTKNDSQGLHIQEMADSSLPKQPLDFKIDNTEGSHSPNLTHRSLDNTENKSGSENVILERKNKETSVVERMSGSNVAEDIAHKGQKSIAQTRENKGPKTIIVTNNIHKTHENSSPPSLSHTSKHLGHRKHDMMKQSEVKSVLSSNGRFLAINTTEVTSPNLALKTAPTNTATNQTTGISLPALAKMADVTATKDENMKYWEVSSKRENTSRSWRRRDSNKVRKGHVSRHRSRKNAPMFFPKVSCEPLRPHVMLYNRIFKTASTTLVEYMKQVSHQQYFYAYDGQTEDWYDTGDSTPYPEIIEKIAGRNKARKTFSAHFYFRKDLQIARPYTYINQVREPIRRFVSHYYYMRSDQRPQRRIDEMWRSGEWNETIEQCFERQHKGCQNNVMTRFFCGTEEYCRTGSAKALHQAMYNMRHYYASIGILEYLNYYLKVLRLRLPRFFPRTGPEITPMKVNDNRGYFKRVAVETLAKIKAANQADIKLYKFAKSLFWKQVRACRLRLRKRHSRKKKK